MDVDSSVAIISKTPTTINAIQSDGKNGSLAAAAANTVYFIYLCIQKIRLMYIIVLFEL